MDVGIRLGELCAALGVDVGIGGFNGAGFGDVLPTTCSEFCAKAVVGMDVGGMAGVVLSVIVGESVVKGVAVAVAAAVVFPFAVGIRGIGFGGPGLTLFGNRSGSSMIPVATTDAQEVERLDDMEKG